MLLNKFLSALLAVVVIIFGSIFSIFAIGKGALPGRMFSFLESMQGSLEYILVFLSITFLGLLYFTMSFKGKAQPTSILIPSEFGEVRISLESIDSLVHQAAKTIKGIKDMKTRIVLREGSLYIYVKAILYGDRNIPELSQQMQGIIQDHVLKISGVDVSEVKVLIENVATDIKARVS